MKTFTFDTCVKIDFGVTFLRGIALIYIEIGISYAIWDISNMWYV